MGRRGDLLSGGLAGRSRLAGSDLVGGGLIGGGLTGGRQVDAVVTLARAERGRDVTLDVGLAHEPRHARALEVRELHGARVAFLAHGRAVELGEQEIIPHAACARPA